MAKRPLLSLCMIARDEERVIGRAIVSARGAVDEVVVVDTGSTDRTPAVAEALGARVYSEPWRQDFAHARNASLAQARGEWIFVLDADEYLDAADARRLRSLVRTAPPDVVGMSVHQVNILAGRREALIDRSTTIRVFRNRPHHRYVFPIHEQIAPSLGQGRVAVTDIVLWHEGFDPGVAAARAKGERNLGILRRVLAEMPQDHPYRWYFEMQTGGEFARMGDMRAAADHLLRAAHLTAADRYNPLNRGSVGVLMANLARALIPQGRASEVLDQAEALLAKGWNVASVWFARGWANVEIGAVEAGVRDLLWATALSEATANGEGYVSEGQLRAAWSLAVHALVRRGAVAAAAALLVHALKARPDDERLVAMATGICAGVPGARDFLVPRLPAASVWPFAQKAASEGRLPEVEAAGRRLAADGDPHAPVAQAIVAIAHGERERARALLMGVDPTSPAAEAARYALARLSAEEGVHAGKQGEVVA
ncbi:MAG: glycosyltransferase family 2 protein [Firmicutes bacterium]|nr:glycosyltransferase family 2 protein [Bacillota bacterium]